MFVSVIPFVLSIDGGPVFTGTTCAVRFPWNFLGVVTDGALVVDGSIEDEAATV